MWDLKTKRGEFPDVTTDQLMAEIRLGSVAPTDEVRSEGTTWQAVGDIPEFRIAIERRKTQHTARLLVMCLVPLFMLTCGVFSQILGR